jgi:hypothetical protein
MRELIFVFYGLIDGEDSPIACPELVESVVRVKKWNRSPAAFRSGLQEGVYKLKPAASPHHKQRNELYQQAEADYDSRDIRNDQSSIPDH